MADNNVDVKVKESGQNAGKEPEVKETQDFEKLMSILSGTLEAKEKTVLKNYFKQQGLSEDEIKTAIDDFKVKKSESEPNIDDLNNQITEANTKTKEAEQKAFNTEVKYEALMLAGELGVENKNISYLLKLADLNDISKDGEVDQAKLKKAMEKVLEDIPALKMAKQEKSGFKGQVGVGQEKVNKPEVKAKNSLEMFRNAFQ